MNKKKIFFISGKRGGYDAMLPLSKMFLKKSNLIYKIIVTDQHLKKEFGSTYKMVEKEIGKQNVIKIKTFQKTSDVKDRLISFSNLMRKLTDILLFEKPNLVIIYGDRGESLISAFVCNNLNIPVSHFQGGDLSGNIDEKFRHAITKLSDLHFVSNHSSYKRLIQLGENPTAVFNVGDSHIDALRSKKIQSKKEIFEKYPFAYLGDYCVMLFHPDGTSFDKNLKYINIILKTLASLNTFVICIYPCTDIGYEVITEQINLISKKNIYFKVYKNIPYNDFISLLKYSKFLIGNSSAGIIETPYLKIPCINLGYRQKGRLTSGNVIHSEIKKTNILKAIKKSQNNLFKDKLFKIKKYYGDGKSYKKSFSFILKNIKRINIHKIFYEKK